MSEAVRGFGKGDFFDEFGFVLGIDLSENGDGGIYDFTAFTEGVCGISAVLSPRVIIRDYVDGDKAVPISQRTEIKVRFLIVKGDPVQERILSCAKAGIPFRCVYTSCAGVAFNGNMLVSLYKSAPAEVFGTEVTAVFTAC